MHISSIIHRLCLPFENTHEAIIDQETFDNVQRIRGNSRRYPNGYGEAAPLTGLLRCADCGGKMYVQRVNNGKRVPHYTCAQYGKVPVGSLCSSAHRIRESVVLDLVSDMLRAIADYARENRAEFIRTVQEAQAQQQDNDIKKKKRRLATVQKRAGELEWLVCKIYEDNALGRLPDARYAALDAQYAKEQDALSAEIAALEKFVSSYEQGRKSAEKFIALIDKYQSFDTMTTTMLNEFVEKIFVHERDRKASGWQRKYEERTRPGKKAKIDAQKAVIRQEDMEKGIYAHVADLPHQEPQKTTLPAQIAG